MKGATGTAINATSIMALAEQHGWPRLLILPGVAAGPGQVRRVSFAVYATAERLEQAKAALIGLGARDGVGAAQLR
jgi:hypothetical protein